MRTIGKIYSLPVIDEMAFKPPLNNIYSVENKMNNDTFSESDGTLAEFLRYREEKMLKLLIKLICHWWRTENVLRD